MKIVLAPDKFKGSLPAAAVAAALRAGMLRVQPDWEIVAVPVADGGDGTADAALAAGYTRVEVDTVGPTGAPVRAPYARRDSLAVVELAAVVGLSLLDAPDPLGAGTFGLGVVIAHALDHGASEIVLGVGGSASTDGGAGMLVALGARIFDAAGKPLQHMLSAARVDLSGLHPRIADTRFVLACDVDNPLLGASGAAAVYGPQKGATPEQIELLDAGMRRWAELLGPSFAAVPGAGTAGGVGFAALAVLGAQRRSGIELMLELTGFAAAVTGADLVITGEGSLDEQSLRGKAPVGVRAAAGAVPVYAVAGRSELVGTGGFARIYPLSALEPDPARSIADAAALLETLGARIASEIVVRRHWGQVMGVDSGTGAGVASAPGASDAVPGDRTVEALIDRYNEPHRRYHTVEHLAHLLETVDLLADHAESVAAVKLAAFYHDAVYDVGRADNEEASARLAESELAGHPEITEIARLVRLTASHEAAAGDRNGAVLCDADLAILGTDPQHYAAYTRQVRTEYAHVPDAQFRAGRAAVLRQLLDLPSLYRTPLARNAFDAAARRNIGTELGALD